MQSFDASATQKNPGFGTGALSEDGKAAYAAGSEIFANYCGDSYVDKASVGGLLIVSAEIDFGSTSQKESMGAEVKASMAGLGSVKAAFDKARSLGATNAKLKISAIQLGGNASHLIDVLGNPDASGKYAAVECSGGNTDACSAFVNKIIDYARGDFKKTIDFDNPNNKKADYYYVFNSHLKKFKDIGIAASLPDLSPETQAAKNYLLEQVKADTEMLDYLQRYQSQPFYASSVNSIDQSKLKQAVIDYNELVGEYTKYNIIDACYGGISDINTECVRAANRVKALRAKYTASINVVDSFAASIKVLSPIGNITFVSTWSGSGCLKSSLGLECVGTFIPYNEAKNEVFNNANCSLDTTSSNWYIKAIMPSKAGKIIVCPFGVINEAEQFYVNGSSTKRNMGGVAGRIINGKEIVYPNSDPVYGFNTWMDASDSSDFKYNPI